MPQGVLWYDEPVKAVQKRAFSNVSLAWLALITNGIVILQGALVRGTGSGAACGSHWPTCNGEIIPIAPGIGTLIEFSHRVLSGGVLLIGVWLAIRAYQARKENPGFTHFAYLSLVFLIIEALIGAATVLLGMTGENTSVARGIWVASHMVNSLVLIGMLAATLTYAYKPHLTFPVRRAKRPWVAGALYGGLILALVVMFTGGIAAMGNTIFPADSLLGGLRADFDPESHPLVRLRIFHPPMAIGVGLYLFVSLGFAWWAGPVKEAKRLAQWLLGVYVVQLVIGVANLALLAPLTMQIIHLAGAVVSYAVLAAFAITLLGGERVRREVRKIQFFVPQEVNQGVD